MHVTQYKNVHWSHQAQVPVAQLLSLDSFFVKFPQTDETSEKNVIYIGFEKLSGIKEKFLLSCYPFVFSLFPT